MKYCFGLVLTLGVFYLNTQLNKKLKKVQLNPLLFSSLFIMGLLVLFKIDYAYYNYSAKVLSYLIGPATVCLAIPLYKMKETILKSLKTIFGSILFGNIIHALSIWGLLIILKLNKDMIVTIIPKSVTTAIAKDLSLSYGGIQEITIALVIVTGVFGAMVSPFIFKAFKIKEKGLALGVSSHAVGTSAAILINEKEATMATLGLILSGLLTVILMPILVYIFI